MLADVGIRRRTDNTKGLEHALRAIVRAGGTLDANWSLRETLRIGDRAVGVPVLTELYERLRRTPVTIDLDTLWPEPDVVPADGGGVRLSDDATDAAIRQAITRIRPAP